VRSTSMRTTQSRGGTPIFKAPGPAEQRKAYRSKPHSLPIRGKALPPGSRALPVQALPVVVGAFRVAFLQAAPGQAAPGESTICPILLHRHNMPRPTKGTAYRRRADMELRELPEYPTSPPRVNAQQSSATDLFDARVKRSPYNGVLPVLHSRKPLAAVTWSNLLAGSSISTSALL